MEEHPGWTTVYDPVTGVTTVTTPTGATYTGRRQPILDPNPNPNPDPGSGRDPDPPGEGDHHGNGDPPDPVPV